MKKAIVLIAFIIVTFNFLSVNAQPQQLKSVSKQFFQYSHIDNDSLLFDGEFGTIPVQPHSNDCFVKIKDVDGKTNGVKRVSKIVTDCSGKVIDTLYTKEIGQLKEGDIVYLGEEISTNDDGWIRFETKNGNEFMLWGPNNAALTISLDFCKKANVFLRKGSIYYKISKRIHEYDLEVTTERASIVDKGTEFTVSVNDDMDVVKVYEGTVEVKLIGTGNIKSIDEAAKEADKLTEDYKNGKITMDEYMKKSKEYLDIMQGKAKDMRKSVMVEAGFMVTASDKISEPVQIPADDIKWFEEK